MNGEYIRSMKDDDFVKEATPYIKDYVGDYTEEKIKKIVLLEKDRIKILSELPKVLSFIFNIQEYEKGILIYKDNEPKTIKDILKKELDIVKKISDDDWNQDEISQSISPIFEGLNNKGVFLHPLRVALSGQKSSPPPYQIMEALGKEESIKRINTALSLL